MATNGALCQICNIVFPDEIRLSSHRLTCTVSMNGPVSFSNAWTGGAISRSKDAAAAAVSNNHANSCEKILPDSQPLLMDLSQLPSEVIPENQREKSRCSHCNRDFKNIRGLGAHLRKCPQKNKIPPQKESSSIQASQIGRETLENPTASTPLTST